VVVRRRDVEVFDAISRGDWATATQGLANDVHHVFPGEHPLGGERRDKVAVLRWFERLGRLFPGHTFTVHRVAVTGLPWDLRVAVQWTARLTPAAGAAYTNEGAHWLRLRGSRVVAFHAYLDTQRVAQACAVMAEAGIEEAAAAPIN